MSEESSPSIHPQEPRALGDAAPAPVKLSERINSIDILRGFAILGILVINIYFFALPFPAVDNPLLMGGTGIHILTWQFTHIFFSLKFMSLFSVLFGAGVILFTSRLEASGRPARGLYYRRILWLLAIGLIHAYLIWMGDILVPYALAGLILYPMRNFRARTLIIIGLIVTLIWSPITFGIGQVMDFARSNAVEAELAREAGETLTADQQMWLNVWEGMSAATNPSPEVLEKEIAAYRGGYFDALAPRAAQSVMMQTAGMIFMIGWRVLGMMLLGMGLYKLGVLSALRSRRFYLLCMIIGYGVGLPIVGYGSNRLIANEFDIVYMMTAGGHFNYIGSIFVMFGHLGLVMFAYQSGWLQALMTRLAAVGRTALSNYLFHSIVFTLIFYGYGLGLYAKIDRFYLIGFVIVMWVIQLYVSPWWLRHYRFGPVEWLWRSLTYKHRQPMRIESEQTSPQIA